MTIEPSEAQRIRRLLDKWGSTIYFVSRKEREIAWAEEMIRDSYCTIGAHVITGDKVTRSPASSGVERAVERVEERVAMYNESIEMCQEAIKKAMHLKAAIDEIIDEFDQDTRDILRMRYVDRHQWAFIALKMSYDERSVRRKELAAVERLSVFVRWNEV